MRPDGLYLRLAIIVAAILLVWYAYYSIVVVPQKKIKSLETELIEQKEVPKKTVDKINKADANRTQKTIDAEKDEHEIIIRDNGILIF